MDSNRRTQWQSARGFAGPQVVLVLAVLLGGGSCEQRGELSESPAAGDVAPARANTGGTEPGPDLPVVQEDKVTSTAIAAGGPAAEVVPTPSEPASGLEYTIERASAAPAAGDGERAPTAEGQPLEAARAEELAKRLPPLPAADVKAFALPPASRPAPTTGAKLQSPFPPAVDGGPPPVVDAAPLEVVRYSPEGEVPLAPRVTIVFNQPMVPLSSLDKVDAHAPATLTPLPKGSWRWLDTKTLVFDPEPRFPMATEYGVEVPAGTRSALGQALAQPLRFGFSTPPLGVSQLTPDGTTVGLQPVVVAVFDQRIDPAALLASVSLTVNGDAVPIRQATSEEIAKDSSAKDVVKSAEPGRVLAIVPKAELPKAANVRWRLASGAPSAEGPRKTPQPVDRQFQTYGPFRLVKAECGWGSECQPLWPWTIEMTNPIDAEAFDPAWVKVNPPVEGLEVEAQWSSLVVSGHTKGRTTYTITLDPALRDQWGQTLGKEAKATIIVGKAEPQLLSTLQDMTLLDPRGEAALMVSTINIPKLRVTIWHVGPEHWRASREYVQARRQDDKGRMPMAPVFDEDVSTKGEPDALAETRIDLRKALGKAVGKDAHGQLFVQVARPGSLLSTLRGRYGHQELHTWVQVTDLGLTAFWDADALLAWVTRLDTGEPVSGATVSLGEKGAKVTTDASGLARLPLPDASAELLVARSGDDALVMPQHTWWWSSQGWTKQARVDEGVFFVFDDRGLYKPGENAKVKGWLRHRTPGPTGDIAAWTGARTLQWTSHDSRGDEMGKGTATINAAGGFAFEVSIPKNANLGHAGLQINVPATATSPEAAAWHTLNVQEFRRPEYEVKAGSDSGPIFIGDTAQAWVTAAYYAGGALPNATTEWQLTASPGSFHPPNHDEYTFGRYRPWWWFYGGGGDDGSGSTTSHRSWSGQTDGAGEERLAFSFLRVNPPQPMVLSARVQVFDVNRQAWSASTSMLVHPASLYPGLRIERAFVERTKPIEVDLVAVDVDGKRAAGVELEVVATRRDWTYRNHQYVETDASSEACRVTSKDQPVRCRFETPEGGSYRIAVRLRDAQGRLNESERTVWVSGGKRPPSRIVEQEKVELVPDRESYAPGDVAKLLVIAPFHPAWGTLTVQREGLVTTQSFAMKEATTTLELPILEAHIAGVTAQVDLVGSATRIGATGKLDEALPRRPAFAQGELSLPVSAAVRELKVTATPAAAELDPGGKTQVEVVVTDASGAAVTGAEVALVVVDEAVLALAGYATADPLAIFYPRRDGGVQDMHARQWLQLEDPTKVIAGGMGMEGNGPGGGGMDKLQRAVTRSAAMPMAPPAAAPLMEAAAEASGEREESEKKAAPDPTPPADGSPIAMRTRFDALALFAPELPTDAQGRATAALELPDSLTRYRIMAVAVDASGKRFGKGESNVTARLPLMVRPSAPRFLRFGDRFELPVVLQNQTDTPMQVEVVTRAANAEPSAVVGKRVNVPARDRVEVRFPASAGKPGTAIFQLAGAAGSAADAATVEIPVWTPATAEAFATYGELDSGAVVYPVEPPTDAHSEFGGLEVSTSTTQVAELTDAVLYLVAYPFECAEQVSSRVLAVAALRDVLSAFHAEGLPPVKELEEAMDRDLAKLEKLQRSDGAFGFWRRDDDPWPYLGIHAAHALARARQKGFEVPSSMWSRSLTFLRNVRNHIPARYGEDYRRVLEAQAVYVRALMDDADAKRAQQLLSEKSLDDHSLETLGWLLGAMAKDAGSAGARAQIIKHLGQRAEETASTAHFTTSYGDGSYLLLHSDNRTDAVVLEGLLLAEPNHSLVPKVVRGLLAHRKAGRWGNTQENAWVLLAMDRYFNTFEKVEPHVVVRAWLGSGLAAEESYQGRSTDTRTTLVPMAWLADEVQGKANLTLGHEGKGRVYYRLGMRYAPKKHDLPPLSRGFSVSRTYQATEDAGDVRQDADGTWRIKAGATVKVLVEMVAPGRRTHAALVDRMPAGFEPVNPDLGGSALAPPPSDRGDEEEAQRSGPMMWWRWWGPWYEHQNLRDDRAEAFASYVPAGAYTYTYYARATTPGTFVAPPPTAEEMYHPETFGRGHGEVVVVE